MPRAPSHAALLLPTCSNSLCVNMRGDSEAGVTLGVITGDEGEGEGEAAMHYCSVRCQRYHAEQIAAVMEWQLQPRGDCSKVQVVPGGAVRRQVRGGAVVAVVG